MASNGARGTVGIVRPPQRKGGYEELVQMLPVGVPLIPLCTTSVAFVAKRTSTGRSRNPDL
jgi:hypothetical protein